MTLFNQAFDTIDHQILFIKLQSYYLHSKSISLLKNYLTNRKQQVIVNDKASGFRDIVCGVPQRSVLGPLLFLIYIKDISTFFQEVQTY